MTYVGKKPADIIATAVDTTTGTFSGDLTVDTNTLYVDSANNRVGVGTVSPANVLHVSGSSTYVAGVEGSSAYALMGFKASGTSGTLGDANVAIGANGDDLYFRSGGAERARIDSSGNVGIGTSSVGTKLNIRSDASDDGILLEKTDGTDIARLFFDGTSTNARLDMFSGGSATVQIRTSGNTHFSGGNVGIGTSSPTASLEISGTDDANNLIVGYNNTDFAIYTDSTVGEIRLKAEDGSGSNFSKFMSFYTHPSGSAAEEAMRIDSSGNLLVGKTSAGYNIDGFEAKQNGKVYVSDSGTFPIGMNRNTDDGDIAVFYKDGTTVGSIGAGGGEIFIGNGDMGIRFDNISDAIKPYNPSSLAVKDAGIDIGVSSQRFKNLYLSGGVYLGGTGSANYLDDYEEGTWTPNIGGDSTYNEQTGKYIKVGHKVTLWFTLRINARNTPSAPYIVAGNPFTNNTSVGGSGVVHYFNSIQNSAVVLTARVDASGGNINLSGATGSATTVANVNHDWAGNGSAVYGFVTFFSQ
jgi:hypothetical protein